MICMEFPVSHLFPYGTIGHKGRSGTLGTIWSVWDICQTQIIGYPQFVPRSLTCPDVPSGTGCKSGTLGTMNLDENIKQA